MFFVLLLPPGVSAEDTSLNDFNGITPNQDSSVKPQVEETLVQDASVDQEKLISVTSKDLSKDSMLKVEWTVKINTGLQSLGDVVVDITLSSQMDILESSIKQISYQNTSPSMPENTMTFQLPDLSEEFEMTFIGTGANPIIGDVYVDVKLTSPKDEFDSYSKRTNLDRTIHNKYSLTVGDIDYANETIQWHFDLDAVTTPVNSLSVSIKLEDNISNQLMNKIYTVATLHDGTVETYPYLNHASNDNFKIHVVTSSPSNGDNKYTLIIENKHSVKYLV